MRILILAEHDGLTLKDEFYKVLNASMQLNLAIDVFIAGYQCQPLCEMLGTLSAVSKVLVIDDVAFRYQPEDRMAKVVASVAWEYSHLFCSTSLFGKTILPRTAAHLNMAAISGVSQIVSMDTFVRPIYAGRLLSKVKSFDSIKIVTLMLSAFPMPEKIIFRPEPVADLVHLAIDGSQIDRTTSFVREIKSISKRRSLQAAHIIVSAGRGLGSKENFEELETLADKLDAAVGATRAVVDAGWLTNDKQIGQTAKIVAPELYIALGISGAPQHLAGMKDSKIIIAVNKDSNAPIFQVANYGFVGDLSDVLPKLNAML